MSQLSFDDPRVVLAFSGPQGSGKTTMADSAWEVLEEARLEVRRFGIKSTFRPLVQAVQKELLTISSETPLDKFWTLPAEKTLQLALSTWAESIYPDIWSNAFELEVLGFQGVTIADDIRTPSNLEALIRLANTGVKVLLFLLQAPEGVRRQRVSVWRSEGLANTEAGLGEIPPGTWVDVHLLSTHYSGLTSGDSLKRSKEALRDILNRSLSLGL